MLLLKIITQELYIYYNKICIEKCSMYKHIQPKYRKLTVLVM